MTDIVRAKDVARRAEVSPGTVSRVFNHHSNVNEELRERVLQAAAELGYFHRTEGKTREKEGNTLSVAVNDVGFLFTEWFDEFQAAPSTFWANILHGAQTEATKQQCRLTYYSLQDLQTTSNEYLTQLYNQHLDGLLLVGPGDEALVKRLQSLHIPLVLVDNDIPSLNVDAVLSANLEGARASVNYLLARGHRQIAFVGGTLKVEQHWLTTIYSIEQRFIGYRCALYDAKLPVLDAMCISQPYTLQTPLSIEGGYAAGKTLLARQQNLDAIFCASDSVAIGVIKALNEAGLNVPDDISVIGYDDIDMAQHVYPALTTTRVPKQAMGSVAMKRLLAQLQETQPLTMTMTLPVELIERSSVRIRYK
jgi:DNA-binding LacI/PurR family transcriptional regulator